MYIEDRPWIFGFSLRQPPYAVVSYARMDPRRLGGSTSAVQTEAGFKTATVLLPTMCNRWISAVAFELSHSERADSRGERPSHDYV
jgi:hypothetical protein